MNGTMAASSNRIMLGPLVAAIDQGTSSTRFLVSRISKDKSSCCGGALSGSHTDRQIGESSVPLPTCAGNECTRAGSAGVTYCHASYPHGLNSVSESAHSHDAN